MRYLWIPCVVIAVIAAVIIVYQDRRKNNGREKEKIKFGYKAFHKDLTCANNFQYEIGKTYTHKGKIEPCESGFHFCKSIAECYRFYKKSEETRICKVEILGDTKTDDEIKYVTNKIKIIEEITEEWERKGNSNSSSSGYGNSGNGNSGDRNSGDWNSGNRNSGDWNSGNRNSGYGNSGDWNSGDWNSGNRNSGYGNSGNGNSGDRNSGDWNSGNRNSGDGNSGNGNSGDWNSGNRNSGDGNSGYGNSGNGNSGDRNSGNGNSGYGNSGDWNSGDWNSGNGNCGVFNTTHKEFYMFNKKSSWTLEQWRSSDAWFVMLDAPVGDYLDNEADELKTHTKEELKKWWDELNKEDKAKIESLPNYDEKIFLKCLGIEDVSDETDK